MHVTAPVNSETLKLHELPFSWSRTLTTTSTEAECITGVYICESFVFKMCLTVRGLQQSCFTQTLHANSLEAQPVAVGAVSSSASRGARGSAPTLHVTILQYATAHTQQYVMFIDSTVCYVAFRTLQRHF